MSYLTFELEPQPANKLTASWKVLNTGGTWLGRISWYAPWRRYCYSPSGPQTMDAACLQEVTNFLTAKMTARKQERAVEKEMAQ